MSYHELSVEERSDIQVSLLRGMSQRAIARILNRSPSTISREIRRNRDACGAYATQHAQQAMRERRLPCRPRQKLVPGNELFELVAYLLRQRFSPEQIASKLRTMKSPSSAVLAARSVVLAVISPVGIELFRSTRIAAASASALSLRWSSRSSWRMRFLSALACSPRPVAAPAPTAGR